MAVIDLDSPAPAGARRRGSGPRALGAVAVGVLLLFGVSGEVNRGSGHFEEAVCDYLNELPSGVSGSRVVVDASTGEVLQTTVITGGCVTTTGG
ncbi:hypothetical protein ACQP2X_16655 [Actinoplanes sp. CA-131856]